ncbi:hypothetical protein [Pseudorhodobacter aquimaris]
MYATTIPAFAPPIEKFSNGREFAAWVAGLYQSRRRPVSDKPWVEPQK